MELRQRALQALCTPDPEGKVAATLAAWAAAPTLPVAPSAPVPADPPPGRPSRPELIHPSKVPRRSPFKPEGLAALLHAIAHIEFNAIKTVYNENIAYNDEIRRCRKPIATYDFRARNKNKAIRCVGRKS